MSNPDGTMEDALRRSSDTVKDLLIENQTLRDRYETLHGASLDVCLQASDRVNIRGLVYTSATAMRRLAQLVLP
jgi:hypothetical protein